MGTWLSFGTQYLWCCLFYSLVAKDCQYPRDPMQPAIKKKKSGRFNAFDFSRWVHVKCYDLRLLHIQVLMSFNETFSKRKTSDVKHLEQRFPTSKWWFRFGWVWHFYLCLDELFNAWSHDSFHVASVQPSPKERVCGFLQFVMLFLWFDIHFNCCPGRLTKTRVCTSCFGSTISGMRLFTKTQICSCFGSTSTPCMF